MKTAVIISTLSLITFTQLGHAREPLPVEIHGRNAIAVAGAPTSLYVTNAPWNRMNAGGTHVAQVMGRSGHPELSGARAPTRILAKGRNVSDVLGRG